MDAPQRVQSQFPTAKRELPGMNGQILMMGATTRNES
jgi:hypothetical protein